MKVLSLLLTILCMLNPVISQAGEPTPQWTFDTSKINPEKNLHIYKICRKMADTLFDPTLNLELLPPKMKKGEPLVADRSKKHPIRESAYYAYALLLTGDPADKERAEKILRQVIAKQEVRPDNRFKGIFAWYWEEDLDKTKRPDDNSAAFVGSTLADIVVLDRKRHVLSDELRPIVENALRLSVEYNIRRNVAADYTNIAILCSAHTAAGAKLLGMKEAGEFAQKKIDEILRKAGDGLFYEYLSPTYTGTDVTGAYLAQKFSFSPQFSSSVKTLIDKIWKEVGESFHAPTLQLAGPHSRAYGDDMREYAAVLKYYIYLARPESYPLPEMETEHAWDFVGILAGADLPIEPRAEFSTPVPAFRKLTASNEDKSPTRELFQYRDKNFILSSIALQDNWEQRRNLVAYWRNTGEGIGGFRLGMCMEKSGEKPPSSGWVKGRFYSKQEKDSVLVVLTHPNIDLQKNGGSHLVFSPTATVEGKNPIVIKDGTITTYLYPISATGNADYLVSKNSENVILDRPWAAADTFGDLCAVSYLIVFRPSSAKPPKATYSGLKAVDEKIEVSANVDGVPLSVVIPN